MWNQGRLTTAVPTLVAFVDLQSAGDLYALISRWIENAVTAWDLRLLGGRKRFSKKQ